MDLTLAIDKNMYNLRIMALVEYRGKFLFDYCTVGQYYFPVGGRVKFGETLDAALIREMREELGIDVQNYQMIGIAEQFIQIKKDWHEHSIVYSIILDDTCELVLEPNIVAISRKDFSNYPIVPSWIESALDHRDTFRMYYVDEIGVERTDTDISVSLDAGRSFNARVSAKVTDGDKVLFDFCAASWGHPVPVGGRMNWGETILEAIHREIREELSTEAIETTFLGVTTDVFSLEKPGHRSIETHFISFNFEVQVDNDAIVFADGCEGVWLNRDAVSALSMKLESFKQFV